MKHFWLLPGLLRLAIASQHHGFNVFDDLHQRPQVGSHPDDVLELLPARSFYEHLLGSHGVQYEVLFSTIPMPEESIPEHIAAASRPLHASGTEPHATPESSLHTLREERGSAEETELFPEEVRGYESMMVDGQRYLCSLPRIVEEEGEKASNTTAEEEAKELELAAKRGWELLKDMEGNCIYFASGWWSYSFCYNEGVRQFHQLPPGRNVPHWPPVEDRTVSAFVLGSFGGDGDGGDEVSERKTLDAGTGEGGKEIRERGLARMETKGEMRYLVQKLGGGTVCDLTGKPRRIEVQFHCDPTMGDRITLIKETSTCQYLMVVSTPRLCNDVAFLPPQESRPYPMVCAPVVPEAKITKWIADNADREEQEDLRKDIELDRVLKGLQAGQIIFDAEGNGDIREAKPYKPRVVGGIEIGGHKVIPKGKKIEKSAVVGGGKETLVATIARSDGFVLSDRELRGLKIPSGKEVEAVKQEVERVAQGKSWRLDVVETPRGRELRGIIDNEENESGHSGAGQEDAGTVEDGDDGGEGEMGSEEGYKEEL